MLVEQPEVKRLPSETKLSSEQAVQFDKLVGEYAGLLPVLESNAAYGETAWLGALALQAGRIGVATHIYEEVNFGTSNVTSLVYVLQGVGIFVGCAVILFLLSLLPLLFGLALSGADPAHEIDLSHWFPLNLFTPEFTRVLFGTLFGCLGGMASLLLKLSDFEILKGKSRAFLRALGVATPLIGGIFASVLGALISAKIINISVGGSSDLSIWFFVVLRFLAGFSERFTRNLLHVAEIHFGGATGPTPQPPQQGS